LLFFPLFPPSLLLQWVNQPVSAGAESSNFGLSTVELSLTHASAADANRATVANLIHSVLSNSAADGAAGAGGELNAGAGAAPGSPSAAAAALAASAAAASPGPNERLGREIEVDRATQVESYRTLFERSSVRPLVASYSKVTDTQLSLRVQPLGHGQSAAQADSEPQSPVLHQIAQTEHKHSRHIFIWPDCPSLSTKDYIQGVYQNYLDQANDLYAQLKADKERAQK